MFASIILFILYLYAFFLAFLHVFITAGLLKAFRSEKDAEKKPPAETSSAAEGKEGKEGKEGTANRKISVIVPARNEEPYLPVLLKSLLKQSITDIEIILVNDRSEDQTLKLMMDFQSKHPQKVKVINNTRYFEGKNPKQMALSLAEKEAEGNIFIYTDADCEVPETWIEYMIKPFSDPDVGLVFGAVTVNPGTSILEKFQMFDHLLRYHYTAASAALGVPTGGFGNNLAIRREALENIGGFKALEYTVTEDAQLIATVRNTGKWKIFPQTSGKSTVSTKAVETWKELYIQELRWSTGALHAPDIMARAGYGFIMYQLVTGLAVLPFTFINPLLLFCFFSGIISMVSVMTVIGLHHKSGKTFWAAVLLSLLPAQILFPVVAVQASFKPKLLWKGNSLKL